ncbi:MAG: 23S rRNA (uracil(1939)-C(5))-methyltransferase RlmD [Saprospiraceae bacterium]
MRKRIVIEKLYIHGIADRGKGVGRTSDGMAVFVEGAVPGDVVDVLLQKKKTDFAEGRVLNIVAPSPERVAPFCVHFGICGGCKWQYLRYEDQLLHKQQVVIDAFQRIAKMEPEQILPILSAPSDTYYRNKLEFGFSNRRWLFDHEMDAGANGPQTACGLGFHKAGYFDKIIDIEHCWLQAEPSNRLRNACRQIALEQGLEFYDLRAHKGYLRNMMVRTATTGQNMLLLSVARDQPDLLKSFLDAVTARFPDLTTIVYCINAKLNDTIFDLEMRIWHGPGYIIEQLGDLRYKIGPKSFFQTNTQQAKRLYDTVLEFAALDGTQFVYDLYTGAGSIALYAAARCRQVVGIEEAPEAIADAEENKAMNGIANADFYCGDVKDVLTPHFAARYPRPDLVITDPPRAGMHEKVVRFLLELAAPRIVYVSCNPATQARDAQLLSAKYALRKIRPVDMFPHTHHIENVALFELKR